MKTRNDILSDVQKLCDSLYKEPVSEKCTDAAQFILRALDYALSTGKEEELARLVQPWLHDNLFVIVKGMIDSP